jgi:hypothetical protein
MGVVVLWVVGKQFLTKHIMDVMLPSPVTDPSAVPSDVSVLINPCLDYFLQMQIPCLKKICSKWWFLGPNWPWIRRTYCISVNFTARLCCHCVLFEIYIHIMFVELQLIPFWNTVEYIMLIVFLILCFISVKAANRQMVRIYRICQND